MNVRISLDNKYIIETIVIEYLIVMGLLSGYIEGEIWKIVLLFLGVLLVMSKKRYRSEIGKLCIADPTFWLIVLIGAVSAIWGIRLTFLWQNVRGLLSPLIMAYILLVLVKNDNFEFKSVLISQFWLLNIFWIMNLVVLSLQCTGSRFMIKERWLSQSSYYADQCAGLFGLNGVHSLGFFSVFMMVYNLCVIHEITKTVIRKRILQIYVLLTELWMGILSISNENMAFFIVIPMFLIFVYFYRIRTESRGMLFWLRKYIRQLILIVVILVGVFSIPVIHDFVINDIFPRLTKIINVNSSTVSGSNERLAIVLYALNYGKGFMFGDGLGTALFSAAGYNGFRHFGVSSIGAFITLGGIWFYIFYCILYAKIFRTYLTQGTQSRAYGFVCFLIVVVLSIYSKIFNIYISIFWISMTFLVLGLTHEKTVYLK